MEAPQTVIRSTSTMKIFGLFMLVLFAVLGYAVASDVNYVSGHRLRVGRSIGQENPEGSQIWRALNPGSGKI